jgi:predicted dehydrogenase
VIKHLAIIGLGSIGCRHLRLARKLRPELEITVVRSGQGEKAPEESIANHVIYSLDQAVASGIDAAVIATPAVVHLQQAKKLLQAGVHVLVEKPLSSSMSGVAELIKLSKRSNLVALLGYCLRYDLGARRFKSMLQNKKIGRVLHARVECSSYLPKWRANRDYRESVSAKSELGGGVLLELSHEFDYVHWFFGSLDNVTAVLHNSGTLGVSVEESSDLILNTKAGIPVSAHLDFNNHKIARSCTAQCTEGNLTWDAVRKLVSWKPADGLEQIERFHHEPDDIYILQLEHFFQCIKSDTKPIVSLEDGAAVLRVIEAARKSNATGKLISLA